MRREGTHERRMQCTQDANVKDLISAFMDVGWRRTWFDQRSMVVVP